MANLADIKRRIGTVKNTRQITRAMKMVAAAKLRRAQERAEGSHPYAEALKRTLGRVASAAGDSVEHPLLTSHDEVKRVLLVVLTSDRGLCGAFNNNLLRQSGYFLEDQQKAGVQVELRTYGKKSKAFFTARKRSAAESIIDLKADQYQGLTEDLAERMSAGFASGEYHEVYLAYNEFVSVMTQNPTFKKVLPLTLDDEGASDEAGVEFEYEPNGAELLNTLLPLQLQTTLLQAFFDSEAGEHAARMTAMDNATRNASDLIDSLTLEYNRARQAAITTQIIEIVSGAEAL
ncbi:MAG: ATP synthase F1 subunit gamma [Alphaproteobacteria bacterium]|nr:ATP synthase F1 subunit gamma [Alphaproteobacteria bacterium]MCB9796331.1 ATP synthase F1 subunit gamma [Alphaproteobacteria bacterium]